MTRTRPDRILNLPPDVTPEEWERWGPVVAEAASPEREWAALDVSDLWQAIHDLRWCKASNLLHALAHDDEDEDGYRAALAARLASPEQEDVHDINCGIDALHQGEDIGCTCWVADRRRRAWPR